MENDAIKLLLEIRSKLDAYFKSNNAYVKPKEDSLSQISAKYETKKISDMKSEGMRVMFRGVVTEAGSIQYDGCLKCRKKSCNVHGQRGKITLHYMRVGDDTGLIRCTFSFEAEVKVGDEVLVKGRTRKWKDTVEIRCDSIEVLTN